MSRCQAEQRQAVELLAGETDPRRRRELEIWLLDWIVEEMMIRRAEE